MLDMVAQVHQALQETETEESQARAELGQATKTPYGENNIFCGAEIIIKFNTKKEVLVALTCTCVLSNCYLLVGLYASNGALTYNLRSEVKEGGF